MKMLIKKHNIKKQTTIFLVNLIMGLICNIDDNINIILTN